MRKISREHSVPIDVGKERYRKPSAGFRIVAHCLNPLALIATVFPGFLLLYLAYFYGESFRSFDDHFGFKRYMNVQYSLAPVFVFGVVMSIYLLFKPVSRGQTPSHYMFGLQMVSLHLCHHHYHYHHHHHRHHHHDVQCVIFSSISFA